MIDSDVIAHNPLKPIGIFISEYALGENENGLQSLYQAAMENESGLHIITVLPLWDEYKNIPSVKKFLATWQIDTHLQ